MCTLCAGHQFVLSVFAKCSATQPPVLFTSLSITRCFQAVFVILLIKKNVVYRRISKLEIAVRKMVIWIHTKKDERILELGLDLPVCRVIVNQAHTFATGGSFTNGLPFSLSMGCGTWQKNTIDNNLNYKHFLNITKVSNLIPGKEANLQEYFKEYCEKNDPTELENLD